MMNLSVLMDGRQFRKVGGCAEGWRARPVCDLAPFGINWLDGENCGAQGVPPLLPELLLVSEPPILMTLTA
jgi:hypothetical protein